MEVGAPGGVEQRSNRHAHVTQIVFRFGNLCTIALMDTARLCLLVRRAFARTLLLLGTAICLSSRASHADPFLGFGAAHQFGQFAPRADLDLLLLRRIDSLGGPPKGDGRIETVSIGMLWRFR